MVTFLPERASSRAAIRPAAPAPTIRKWVRCRGPSIIKIAFWDVRLHSQPDWWFDQCLCRHDGSPAGPEATPKGAAETRRPSGSKTKSRLISLSVSVDFCRNSMEESYVLFASSPGGGRRCSGCADHQPCAGLGCA